MEQFYPPPIESGPRRQFFQEQQLRRASRCQEANLLMLRK